MESWQGKAFQTEGTECAKSRRQGSRFKASVARVEEASGEWRRRGQVRAGIGRALWAMMKTLAVTSSEVGATGGLWAAYAKAQGSILGSNRIPLTKCWKRLLGADVRPENAARR